jgi:two-component system invasion response regulator UvrY
VAGRPDNLRRLDAVSHETSAPVPPRVRTLIVDDSEAVRDGLSMLLESRPYCELVGAVSDPDEALERVRAMRPDVVLQDFSMPGVDAIALVRDVSACRPRPAVLMLSAFADAAAARRAVEAGAIGWVLKDAEPQELFAALLGAAGFRDRSTASAPHADRRPTALSSPLPEPEPGASLDARTVWALLRALEDDPAGMTVERIANHAVLPVAIAVRYLQRMALRQPALVAPTGGTTAAGAGAYVLTGAGRRELARLERRMPAACGHAHAASQLLR